MNRKAIELSANFIVVLIISLVVFTGGLAIAYKFFGKAIEYRAHIDSETETELERIMSSGEKVAIPRNDRTIKIGSSYVFGLGVFNGLGAGQNQQFYVSMSFNKAIDSTKAEITSASQPYINSNWIFSSEKTFTIRNNDYMKIPLYVAVKDRISPTSVTKPGTYVFDVCVCTQPCTTSSLPCSALNAAGLFYDGHVHKVYVEVP